MKAPGLLENLQTSGETRIPGGPYPEKFGNAEFTVSEHIGTGNCNFRPSIKPLLPPGGGDRPLIYIGTFYTTSSYNIDYNIISCLGG